MTDPTTYEAQAERLRRHATTKCGHAMLDPNCVSCCPQLQDPEHCRKCGLLFPSMEGAHTHEEGCLGQPRDPVFVEYKRATIALRDCELAYKAAQDAYRRALEALNKAIAPFPEKP